MSAPLIISPRESPQFPREKTQCLPWVFSKLPSFLFKVSLFLQLSLDSRGSPNQGAFDAAHPPLWKLLCRRVISN